MSIKKWTPDSSMLFASIRESIKEIKPGERVQVLVPRTYSHGQKVPKGPHDLVYINENERDWDDLEELQMEFRGSTLPPNVFVTLRFDQKDEGEVTVDICHLA